VADLANALNETESNQDRLGSGDGASSSRGSSIERNYDRGKEHLIRDEWTKAKESFERILSDFDRMPNDPRAVPATDDLLHGKLTEATWGVQWKIAEALDKLHDVIDLYSERGKGEEAAQWAEKVVASIKRKFGEGDIKTAESQNKLASCYGKLGRYDKVEPLAFSNLEIFGQKLGMDDPQTKLAMENLAIVYERLDKDALAEPLRECLLAMKVREVGRDHRDTIQPRSYVAQAYEQQDKYKEAEPLRERNLTIVKREFGENHAETARAQIRLASVRAHLDKVNDALSLYEDVFPICLREFGSNHRDTEHVRNNMQALSIRKGVLRAFGISR
jgi:tetratricopeptide (TPR) repeat protein